MRIYNIFRVSLFRLKKLAFIYILLFSWVAFPQVEETPPLKGEDYILIKDGDTLTINLDEVTILPKRKFTNSEDARYYFWFKRKVFKAYPYAKIAKDRLDSLNSSLSLIEKKSKKRRYTRKAQKYLEKQFTDQLKKMTKTEGRILIKLIHRQTGKTAYQNIRNLRSGWKAFWYNASANVFKLSLKTEYNPVDINEDYLIEEVLQRAFIDEQLEAQPSMLDFDFLKIAAEKNGVIDVEEYKQMFAKMRKKKEKRKKVSSSKSSQKVKQD